MKQKTKNIAIFASGTGSNAQKIIDFFKDSKKVKVALIVCNNPQAYVLKIAANENIPVLLIEKQMFQLTGYIKDLESRRVEFIILAGFLWKIPPILISAFEDKIINIHPALLPAFGGKGMYGKAVHVAVLAAKEKQSGITIHYVDDKYDHGKIIFQATCPVDENETVESLSQKIQRIEHEFYVREIEKIIDNS